VRCVTTSTYQDDGLADMRARDRPLWATIERGGVEAIVDDHERLRRRGEGVRTPPPERSGVLPGKAEKISG